MCPSQLAEAVRATRDGHSERREFAGPRTRPRRSLRGGKVSAGLAAVSLRAAAHAGLDDRSPRDLESAREAGCGRAARGPEFPWRFVGRPRADRSHRGLLPLSRRRTLRRPVHLPEKQARSNSNVASF